MQTFEMLPIGQRGAAPPTRVFIDWPVPRDRQRFGDMDSGEVEGHIGSGSSVPSILKGKPPALVPAVIAAAIGTLPSQYSPPQYYDLGTLGNAASWVRRKSPQSGLYLIESIVDGVAHAYHGSTGDITTRLKFHNECARRWAPAGQHRVKFAVMPKDWREIEKHINRAILKAKGPSAVPRFTNLTPEFEILGWG